MSLSLQDYARLAEEKAAHCFDCGGPVTEANLRHYNHENGWLVAGFDQLQWLFFECPKPHCGYQTSLAKLHIDRPEPQ